MDATQSVIEPSVNRQQPSEHPLFAEFYDVYPRKAARKKAAEAFWKLNPDREQLAVLLKAINAQALAQRCADGDARFVPHPAAWINGRRWEDQAVGKSDGRSAGAEEQCPSWLKGTPFANVYEAENAGCWARNAHMFRRDKGVAA